MSVSDVARYKTALTRTALSRPIARAMTDGLLESGCAVFDYGCGKGDDVRHLRSLGYDADGWDPTHRPTAPRKAASIVNLGYVINVIENPTERVETLRTAWGLAERILIVSARMAWDARDLVGRPLGDGLLTRSGTFQKFYQQPELAAWIEEVVGVHPHAAAPGIFYLFRNEADAQRFLASRVYTYRPRISVSPEALYETNREVMEPLVTFMSKHARAPRTGELPVEVTEPIRKALGGIGSAERLIRQITDASYWDQVTVQRRAELLIYVALSRFRRRPRFSQLDRVLATDIRTLFGTYQQVCLEADRMLVACGDQALLLVNARSSKVGKQTPSALYVHRSAMGEIPPMLQVYEGCARVLAGTVEHANMIKLSVVEPQVSYLTYPTFDRDPHPTLHSAVTVNLRKLSVDWRDYSRSENPPLLHRKEEFLGIDDPKRPLYERLTRAEMRAGLYGHPEQIGNLKGWQAILTSAGISLRGHRIVRR
ncbi:SAM-dependent methyltransferase [Mycobacterium sp. 852013-50091_SCH5140682]|uniref:DNA phosphorothioation-associated putative methyltransferase n=1 Tax=Mycobacterium sp. 852013-50091_SCH5140682 TaxID=1834109 RepID=UPI0007EB23E7|nr:DNA phosphorothioation-associated putative methyltransferase [Mycobacterium sp. 852013-50091_SCH5140682]OBC03472.1 SAM-dependent methyltransferase [Mycobacterium sp. 852013-50091_SCH5140682]